MTNKIEFWCKEPNFQTKVIKTWTGEIPKVDDYVKIDSVSRVVNQVVWDLDDNKILIILR